MDKYMEENFTKAEIKQVKKDHSGLLKRIAEHSKIWYDEFLIASSQTHAAKEEKHWSRLRLNAELDIRHQQLIDKTFEIIELRAEKTNKTFAELFPNYRRD